MKPKSRTETHAAGVAGRLLEALPPGMDLLLPGTAERLADALGGYRLDLLVVYGFNWRLPAAVLRTPRSGVINIHSSLDQVTKGDPGVPQDQAGASCAGFLEPEFSVVDWSRTSAQVHNQVRMFRFMGPDHAPAASVGGRWLKVLRTRLEPADGIRVECADGPIWIVESAPAQPPVIHC